MKNIFINNNYSIGKMLLTALVATSVLSKSVNK